MRVTEENYVDFCEPRICRTSDSRAYVVKNADSSGIFEKQRAIVQAQFSGM